MPLAERVRQALNAGLRYGAVLTFLAPLLTRLVVGFTFHETGSGKLEAPERVAAFFAGLGIPFPEANAAFVARVEYYGGLALVLGLGTRIAAAFLAGTMVVALLTADRSGLLAKWAESGFAGLSDVLPVMLLLPLLWLVFYGPGAASLDALVQRGWRRFRDAPPSQQG